ncbi:Signal transduction histidine kinase [Blastococcus haudaquaticus]|uniref:histidine kinase n=2 Tax=Blastococcus haudaquaticus TaxID=1938745 RepID=A0A286GPW5_9ACTN|nr:Signal transduction histidine kinase [Blastococcus haudaquaticus]
MERVDAWVRRREWVTDLLLASVLAGLVAPVSVTMVAAAGLDRGWTVALWCLLGSLHLAVAFRRSAPVPAFLVLATAELGLALAPFLSGDDAPATTYPAVLLPSSLAYLIGAYSISAYGRQRWPELSLLVGLVGGLLVTVRVATVPGPTTALGTDGAGELLLLAVAVLGAVTAAWALGRFRRVRADQLAALAERARRAEADREQRDRQAAADERARIAREMHDVVAHSVTVMVRQAEGGRYVAATDPAAAATALATIAETGRTALTDMRSLLGVLDPATGPAAAAPQPTIDDLPELVRQIRASGQPVTLRIDGDPRPLDRAAHLAAYRLVQEALTNVVKHAGPDVEAEVVLTWDRQALRLQVTDQGTPPRATDGVPAGGRGLTGMRERLHLVGGRLSVGPAESGGFSVVGEIPTAGAGRARGGRR